MPMPIKNFKEFLKDKGYTLTKIQIIALKPLFALPAGERPFLLIKLLKQFIDGNQHGG